MSATSATTDPGTPEDFDAIRPYRDDEVADVLARLLGESELLDAVARFRLPRMARWLPGPARALVRAALRRGFGGASTVADFQPRLESWFDRMIEDTTAGFTFSGVDRLQADRAYLFVGNHRDIAMDSGLLNYALHAHGRPTCRIAIGDNLLKKDWMTDVMRLNKSFVIRRSARRPKEMLAAFNLTSRYLHHSIGEGESVWIAQREGRAKDGIDRTEPAIIKMFHMSQRKSGRDFAEVIAALHIVPVSISYELDPCDGMKAHELAVTARSGSYAKPDDEDIRSIVTGITGYKGRVHLHLGEELTQPGADADAVAAQLDEAIVAGFRLWPTHLEAYRRLEGSLPEALLEEAGSMPADLGRRFEARIAQTPEDERDWLLNQYANPVRRRLGALDVGA